MSTLKIKDFLNTGAFLQSGPDQFKLLMGPFSPVTRLDLTGSGNKCLLWKPKFWSFLHHKVDIFESQNSVYAAAESLTLNRSQFLEFLNEMNAIEPQVKWEKPEEDLFRLQFEWTQARFGSTQLKKTVPIIRQSADQNLSINEKVYLLKKLLLHDGFGWAYGFYSEEGSFLGQTPEILGSWNLNDQIFRTMALAGTLTASAGPIESILEDEKILEEHRIVIRDIEERIKFNFQKQKLPCNLKVKATEPISLKYLVHLHTPIEVGISSFSVAISLLQDLHPTSALGFYPRDFADIYEFANLELQLARRNFAAPFGVLEKNSLHCVAAIRNLMFDENRLEIFSGCGVTPQSDFNAELLEVEQKRNSVKKILGLYAH